MSVVYTEGLGIFASESSRWRNEGKWTLVQILSTTFVSSSKLLRTTEKKQRGTQWTFVWISNTVKSTAVKVATAITIMTETGAIPRPVAERNPRRTRLRPTKEQSALTFHSYQCNLTRHRPSRNGNPSILSASPVVSSRKSQRKRSRSSSSSSSSSSEPQQEDSFAAKSNPEDKSFHTARAGQNEPSLERGKPHGGIVSLPVDVFSVIVQRSVEP